jgi:hypothetical protein
MSERIVGIQTPSLTFGIGCPVSLSTQSPFLKIAFVIRLEFGNLLVGFLKLRLQLDQLDDLRSNKLL